MAGAEVEARVAGALVPICGIGILEAVANTFGELRALPALRATR